MVFSGEGGRSWSPCLWLSIAAFAAYDLWMLLFPLQGLGLLATAGPQAIAYWLLPHTLTLTLLALGPSTRFVNPLSIGAVLITALLTGLFPFFPEQHNHLLVILGVASALTLIRCAALLCHHPRPWEAAAYALIAANILLSLSFVLHLPIKFLFLGLGALLLVAIFPPMPAKAPPDESLPLRPYLPFIFSFYLLSALLYIVLMPHYVKEAYLLGAENLFYIATILLAVALLPKEKDLVLVLGVVFGIFALSFFRAHVVLAHNLSMFAIQAAVGLVDLFCLYLFLRGGDLFPRLARGLACVFWGVTTSLPLFYLADSEIVLIGGNIILGLSILAFYLTERQRRTRKIIILHSKAKDLTNSLSPTPPQTPPASNPSNPLLDQRLLREKLSQREWEVFRRVISGKSIKEMAQELTISESSVKTYLRRVYKKAGVKNKEELLRRYAGEG